jgi:hypothetical protein
MIYLNFRTKLYEFKFKRKLNRFVFIFIITLIIISLACLIGSIFYESLFDKHWYLFGRKSEILNVIALLFYFYITIKHLV